MKKLFSIFLLIVFLLNSVGFLLMFKLSQDNIRGEIKDVINGENFDQKELAVINIDSKQLKDIIWDGQDEFSYKGVRYDLVEKKTNNNGTVDLYCINDKKETSLLKGLDSFIKNHFDTGSSSKSEKGFLKLLLKEYSDNFYSTVTLVAGNVKTVIYKDPKQTLPSFIFELATPPPRLTA